MPSTKQPPMDTEFRDSSQPYKPRSPAPGGPWPIAPDVLEHEESKYLSKTSGGRAEKSWDAYEKAVAQWKKDNPEQAHKLVPVERPPGL